MSDQHPPNRVPQSVQLCAGHSDPTKAGSLNRSHRRSIVSAYLPSAMRQRPNGIVHVMPDVSLGKPAILDLINSLDVKMVWVGPEYAKHFKQPPNDGRTYIVQDPHNPHLCHWTHPDGKYECRNTNSVPKVGASKSTTGAKRIFRRDRANNKGKRVASEFGSNAIVRPHDAPLSICLIDIHRVMRITGFKKSFIYEQVDFPEPVRLGTSRRSSVRWVESEIYQWVSALLSKRINTVSMQLLRNSK